jgi:hypothetical protein
MEGAFPITELSGDCYLGMQIKHNLEQGVVIVPGSKVKKADFDAASEEEPASADIVRGKGIPSISPTGDRQPVMAGMHHQARDRSCMRSTDAPPIASTQITFMWLRCSQEDPEVPSMTRSSCYTTLFIGKLFFFQCEFLCFISTIKEIYGSPKKHFENLSVSSS